MIALSVDMRSAPGTTSHCRRTETVLCMRSIHMLERSVAHTPHSSSRLPQEMKATRWGYANVDDTCCTPLPTHISQAQASSSALSHGICTPVTSVHMTRGLSGLHLYSERAALSSQRCARFPRIFFTRYSALVAAVIHERHPLSSPLPCAWRSRPNHTATGHTQANPPITTPSSDRPHTASGPHESGMTSSAFTWTRVQDDIKCQG